MDLYLTDDGLEIPAPRRELGPRRLSRYQQEAAELMRALRDGSSLPENPVEDLGDFPLGEPGSQARLIHDRYQEALASGAFILEEDHPAPGDSPASTPKSPWADNKATDSKSSNKKVAENKEDSVSEASSNQESEEKNVRASQTKPAEKESVDEQETIKKETSDTSPESKHSSKEVSSKTDEESALSIESATDLTENTESAEDSTRPERAEELSAQSRQDSQEIAHQISADGTEAQKIVAASDSLKSNEQPSLQTVSALSQVSEGLHSVKPALPSLSSFTRVQDKLEEVNSPTATPVIPDLPKPISALSAQGLDLDALNKAEERAARKKAAQDEAKHEQEQIRKAKAEEAVRLQAIAAIEAENKAQEEAAAVQAAAEKKKKHNLWIGLLLLLVVVALLVVWLMFFQ